MVIPIDDKCLRLQTCRYCVNIQSWQAKFAIYLLRVFAIRSPHSFGISDLLSDILTGMTTHLLGILQAHHLYGDNCNGLTVDQPASLGFEGT